MSISNKKYSRQNLLIFLIILSIFLVIGLCAGYFVWRNSHKVTTLPSTSAQEDKASAEKGVSQKNSNSVQTSRGDKQSNVTPSSSNILMPQGNFVSSHNVSLGSTVESVCVTTKGAVCEINYTQNGTTKSLGKKTVDNNGSVTWLWTPESINLTVGSWEISATSSLNGLQSTAKDPLSLEVGQ